MDRAVLQTGGYPRAKFVDAFLNVVWLRGAFAIPPDAAYEKFRVAVRHVLGASDIYSSCGHPSGAHACGACSAATPLRIWEANVVGAQCHRRASMLIERIFFGEEPEECRWTGPLVPCAVRCHRIVMGSSRWEIMENIMLIDTWHTQSDGDVDENEVDWLDVEIDGAPLTGAADVMTRNATAFTAGIVILCSTVTHDHAAARQLYIDVREALRTMTFRSEQARAVYNAIVAALFPMTREHDTSPDLVPHMKHFSEFIVKRANMVTAPVRVSSCASLQRRRGPVPECALTRTHTLHRQDTQCGAYVEIQWSEGALSWLECRMTLHLWTHILKVVDPMHALIKPRHDGGTAIVLREADFVRLLRYAPAHLHCARIISLRMPVYKMLCQNYVQLNADLDAAAAALFVADFMSLISDHVPANTLQSVHTDIGLLHALLSVFGDTLALHATQPYLDPENLQVSHCAPIAPASFAARRGNSEGVFGTGGLASVVNGFKWSSTTIYGFLMGFLCIKEPHIISTESVCALRRTMAANLVEQRHHVAVIHVIGVLETRMCMPSENIDGVDYVDIPVEIGAPFPQSVAPVVLLYGLLTSTMFDRKLAAKILLSIRLSPTKSCIAAAPMPMHPAAQRPEGIAGLRNMHREYAAHTPEGLYTQLYAPTRVAELGCMQYFTFFLEMLTYAQTKTLCHDNLEQCQREFGRFGTRPHAPLTNESYRGMVTPQHILRYARRDEATHQPAVTSAAYELEAGVFQHQVVPTMQFARANHHVDMTRAAAFHSNDAFMRECLFMIPVGVVRANMPRWNAKRKLDAIADAYMRTNPNIAKRIRNEDPPPLLWAGAPAEPAWNHK